MQDEPNPGTKRSRRLAGIAAGLGMDIDGPIVIGGRYEPALAHGGQLFVSGQVPRIGDTVVVTGRAGEAASLEDARRAARICAVRALALAHRAAGGLERVARVLKLTVYVQSAPGFTQQSEVADAASDLLCEVLGDAGRATRTSVGVAQLPKDATVELDLVAALGPEA